MESSSGRREHWERIYREKASEERSWFQPRPELSLELIRAAGCGPASRIIDIGGGTSLLVDCLLAEGYENVCVLDIAASALEEAKRRLGERANEVRFVQADITSATLPGPFDLWHDRAVFHFLIEPRERASYVRTLKESVRSGGHAIIATFAEDGPTHCSGLPVVRYSPSSLVAELGAGFRLVESRDELHQTPGGRRQSFVYCLFALEG